MHPVKFTLVSRAPAFIFGFPVQPYPVRPIDTTQTACQRQAMRLGSTSPGRDAKTYYKKDSVQWELPHCRAKEQAQARATARKPTKPSNLVLWPAQGKP